MKIVIEISGTPTQIRRHGPKKLIYLALKMKDIHDLLFLTCGSGGGGHPAFSCVVMHEQQENRGKTEAEAAVRSAPPSE